MAKEKACPFLSSPGHARDCIKDRCEFWLDREGCTVLSIALKLTLLSEAFKNW